MPTPATVADLVRLEDEIDEALLNMLNKPADPSTIADLKRRKDHLRHEIAWLMHEVEGLGAARTDADVSRKKPTAKRFSWASAAANRSGSRGADRR